MARANVTIQFRKKLEDSITKLGAWVEAHDYKGYDPEVNAAGQSTVLRGIDFGAVPVPRTFSINVAAKF